LAASAVDPGFGAFRHVAHFVRDTARTGLDLSAIMDSYDEERAIRLTIRA